VIVVTGGAGAMGLRLVRLLRERGSEVCAVGLPADPNARLVERLGARYRGADIRDPSSLVAAFEGATRVVHLAALVVARRQPELLHAINVEGTRNVLDAAVSAGASKFVHVSSISVHYGQQNDYSRSKRDAEGLVRDSALDWTILRPTLAWGDPAALEYASFARIVAKWPLLPLPERGRAMKSPVHVDDLATAFAAAMEPTVASRMSMDLPGPERLSLRQMAVRIRRSRGSLGATIPVPRRFSSALVRTHAAIWRSLGLEPFADWQTWTGLVEDAAPDPDLARQVLSWNPRAFDPTVDGLGEGTQS
jgi:nucleoside-diphosphate-sugar epimerase